MLAGPAALPHLRQPLIDQHLPGGGIAYVEARWRAGWQARGKGAAGVIKTKVPKCGANRGKSGRILVRF